MWFLLALSVLCCALLGGCTTAGGSSKESGGTTVGPAIAEAELKPVGDFSTSGTAVFKRAGSTGVQLELSISGLPTKDPEAAYYAQVHEGSCSDERSSEEHEEHGARAGLTLALLRFEWLLAKGPILAKGAGGQAHGGEETGIPKEPPGSIEQPVSFGASADGSASVSSLLEGVAPERLTSGAPEYIHLHAVGSEDAPEEEELACGNLKATRWE